MIEASAQATQEKDEDTIDDFMDGIGLDVKPTGPEDALMIQLTGGGFNQLHTLRYWLMHNLHEYYAAKDEGTIFMRRSNITRELVEITIHDYAKIMVKYYLRMKYLPYFNSDVAGLGKADLNKMAELVLRHEAISTMVEKKREELPKLSYL